MWLSGHSPTLKLHFPVWKMGTIIVAHSWTCRDSMRFMETLKDTRYVKYITQYLCTYEWPSQRDFWHHLWISSSTTFLMSLTNLQTLYGLLCLFRIVWLMSVFIGAPPYLANPISFCFPDLHTAPLIVHTQSHSCTCTYTGSSAPCVYLHGR